MSAGDHSAYRAFVRRIMRAYARRVSDADPEDLAELVELRTELDATIAAAVHGLRANGSSWTDIARAVGITRQAAQQRWCVNPTLTADSRAAGQ